MSDLVSQLTSLAIAAGDPSADLTIVAEGVSKSHPLRYCYLQLL